MGTGRQTILLVSVAGTTGEDEVVAEICRVENPGNEVVDFRNRSQGGATVEAAPVLKVAEDWGISSETRPLSAEEELLKFGSVAEKVIVVCANIADPAAPSQFDN
jgi:hypothetical protein